MPTTSARQATTGSTGATVFAPPLPSPSPFSPSWVVALGIRGYQRFVSPYKGFVCAHRVLYGGLSCSEYARQVLLEQGCCKTWQSMQSRFRSCRGAAATIEARFRLDRSGRRKKKRWYDICDCGLDLPNCDIGDCNAKPCD